MGTTRVDELLPDAEAAGTFHDAHLVARHVNHAACTAPFRWLGYGSAPDFLTPLGR